MNNLAIISLKIEKISLFIKELKNYFNIKELNFIKNYLNIKINYNMKESYLKLN